jgi:hypothetical protein
MPLPPREPAAIGRPDVAEAPAEEPATVRISIGRIEVTAAPPAAPPAPPSPASLARPKQSLDDYLAARDGGHR